MRPNRTMLGIALIGALLIIASVLWEYGRVNPGYLLIVEPWSIRGFETVHGAVFAAIGVALIIAIVAVAFPSSTEPKRAPVIVLAMAVLATIVGLIFGSGPHTTTPGAAVGFTVSAVIGLITAAAVKRSLVERSKFMRGLSGPALVWLGAAGISYVVLNAAVVGKEFSLRPGWWILLICLILAGLSIAFSPIRLAPNRMLMFMTIVGWMAITTSAGAIRSTLLRLQEAELGVSALYKDVQITSGWFLAEAGAALVFIGAVAMWARRKDSLAAQARANRQRAAAEKSAAEIAAALEGAGTS